MHGSVTSRDGTRIAYERVGGGPAVVLVGGGLDDGAENAPIAPLLGERFTVFNYARRGRGASGDTAPYAVAREIEDVEALIAAAGGTAHSLGVSSGGALALAAAAAGAPIGRVAVYEVPYSVDDALARRWVAYVEELDAALADGRRGDALALAAAAAAAPEESVAAARGSALWPGLEALAHTLAYDAACLGDGRPPRARLAAVEQPTLVLTGGQASGFFDAAADAIAATVPKAERGTLAGQGHVADPAALAGALARFFAG